MDEKVVKEKTDENVAQIIRFSSRVETWEERSSFLTGSYAYGIPRPDSDIDIVVLEGESARETLDEASDGFEGNYKLTFENGKKVNLLMMNRVKYDIWKKVTVALRAFRPVSRDLAVACFRTALKNIEKNDCYG